MGWMVAMVLAVSSTTDGGASSEPAPLFHEPMTRPVPLGRFDWTPPRGLVAARIGGLLILRCVITEVGTVEACEVVKPLPEYTEWALEKLKTATTALPLPVR